MHRQPLVFLFFVALLSVGKATPGRGQELARLNEIIAEAARRHDALAESEARLQRICYYYNNDLNDSLYHQAPLDIAFNRQHGIWDNYYVTWNHLANDYIFDGKVNTGLRQLEQMHQDAVQRQNLFGMAIANYGMGNAYINMERYNEAEQAYDQSLTLMEQLDTIPSMMNDLFSYYCDVLNDKHEYEKMQGLLDRWEASLKDQDQNYKEKEGRLSVSSVWLAYYNIARAQAHLGLNQLDAAAYDLDEVERLTEAEDETFLRMSLLYYRAQLFLQQGNYAKALEQNSKRLRQSENVNDVSSPILIRRQRAEILKKLGQYEEAAEMYLQMYQLKDSFNNRSMRDQANELNTLFRVDELSMERKLEQSRYLMVIALVAGLFLALFMAYWYFMSRRLRRKNEELRVARDQAQESSLMKTKFIQNISHEIRTPLNILSGFSQLLAQPGADMPDAVKHEAGEKIVENTNRITALINQLLALSEAGSRTHIERADTLRCNELCADAIAKSRVEESAKHHFTFVTQLSDDEQLVTSRHYSVDALSHLLENALKFTPAGGSIRLVCSQQDRMLQLAVEDTGCGVPAGEAEHVFEEFVQLDEYSEGVGVGLSVSRNVIRRLGGDIVLDTAYPAASQPDSPAATGARFVLTLPMA